MARFSRRTNKKSFRKRKSRKGSRKIRRGGVPGYNPSDQFSKKKIVAPSSQNTGPKKDFISQNKSSVIEQSNQKVAQAASAEARKAEAIERKQEMMRRQQIRQKDAELEATLQGQPEWFKKMKRCDWRQRGMMSWEGWDGSFEGCH